MGNCLRTPTVCFSIVSAVVTTLQQCVGSRRRDTLFGQDTGNLHRTVAVNAKLENFAYHLGGRLVNHPQILVGIRLLVAIHGRTQVLAWLSFCPEHRTNLLTAITGIPVIEDIFESKQFILGLRCINIIVHGDISHIVVGEHHFDQLTSFQVITTEPWKVFGDNRSNLAVLNFSHHRFEAVTLPSRSAHSVIDVESRIGKAVVLSEFL